MSFVAFDKVAVSCELIKTTNEKSRNLACGPSMVCEPNVTTEVKFDMWLTVQRNSVWITNQPDVTFV